MSNQNERGPQHASSTSCFGFATKSRLFPTLAINSLDLSDEQRSRVDSLLEEQREKADQLLSDMEPRLKALHDSTNSAIERLLTPEQREEFERIKEERREVIVRSFIEPGPGAKIEIMRGPTFQKRILRSDRQEER